MKSKIVLVLALLGSTALAIADSSRQVNLEWLSTIALAAHQTNYSGTFVHQYGNRLEASNINHIFDQSGEQAKLKKQDGSRCEVTGNNSEVWCYPGDKGGQTERAYNRKAFPVLLPEQLSTLGENYQINAGESARIAGFETRVLELRPKDNLRYSHKMWVHKDTGLLLKAAILSDRQEVVEQYTFIQLKINSHPKHNNHLGHNNHPGQANTQKINSPQTAAQNSSPIHSPANSPVNSPATPKALAVTEESVWKVDALPAGFKKIAEMRRPMRGKKGIATQMVFSDGLVGISVFIEARADNPDSALGLSSQGAIHIYSKLNGDHLVTVVGEVPPSTVLQVADSVRHRG